MAICAFLGHREVYDKGLYRKLLDAVFTVAGKSNAVTFLFCRTGRFYDLCLAAALEAKQHFPQKQIALTWVANPGERDAFAAKLGEGSAGVPPCMIDHVISPPPAGASKNRSPAADVERWALQQSTHLISYVYPGLLEPENYQYRYARKKGIPILDIANPETAAYIEGLDSILPEREQVILKRRKKGETQKEVGMALGVSASTIDHAESHAGRRLREHVLRRLSEMDARNPEPPVTCSVFLLKPATYENLSAFEKAVSFLLHAYDVCQFRVLEEYCHSGYIYVLKHLRTMGNPQAVAITHYPEQAAEKGWEAIAASLIPPCDAAENIQPGEEGRIGDTIKAMMEQADFCICSLSGDPLGEEVKGYIAEVPGVKVLNLGKKPAGA